MKFDISQNQAARILGKSPRTLGRMVERSEIHRDETTGKYSREEVEELAETLEEEAEQSSEKTAMTELREGYGQAVNHAERLLALLEKPIHNALETVSTINGNLLTRMTEQEASHLEMMKALGDMLLAKEEREAVQAERVARIEALKSAGAAVGKHLPLLFSQMSGGKSAFKDFFDKLDKEEKEGIAGLYYAFDEPDKKAAFKVLCEAVGLKIPPSPDETVSVPSDVSENPSTEVPSNV